MVPIIDRDLLPDRDLAREGAYVGSAVNEGDETHRLSLHRTTAFRAVILVFALLLSSSVVSITDSFGTHSSHVAGDDARTAAVDPGDVTLTASPWNAFVNDTIIFYANASSDDAGATLTFTIFYDYLDIPYPTINAESPVTVNTTGSTGSVIQTYAYNHPGNYTQAGHPFFWVYLFVSDGTSNESAIIQVFVSPPLVNMPPFFIYAPADPLHAQADVVQYILIDIADPDSDSVTVFWDFGDGTNATNVTVAPPTGIVLNQTHTWAPRIPGMGGYSKEYTLNVSLSDGQHPPVNSSTVVNITVPYNWPPNLRVTASKLTASPLESITFTANASDPEGDPLTWTFNYSDGTVDVYHSGFTDPGLLMWQNTTHSFATVGNYTVYVSLSDALVPFQVGEHNITVRATVRIIVNVAPIAYPLNVNPGAPQINATLGYVNATVSIEAYDLDGDMFNLTWDLGVFGIRTNISVGDAAQRKEPYRYRQVLQFTETGSYPITVTVTDGRPGHEVQRTTIVNVSSNNLPPSVLAFNHDPYAQGDFASPDESVKFRLVITDSERDAIELAWDFGDGSPMLYMNLTNYDANGNITVSVNHSYAMKGNYTVTIVLTDNKIGYFNHTLTSTMPIRVSVRPPAISEFPNVLVPTIGILVLFIGAAIRRGSKKD